MKQGQDVKYDPATCNGHIDFSDEENDIFRVLNEKQLKHIERHFPSAPRSKNSTRYITRKVIIDSLKRQMNEHYPCSDCAGIFRTLKNSGFAL